MRATLSAAVFALLAVPAVWGEAPTVTVQGVAGVVEKDRVECSFRVRFDTGLLRDFGMFESGISRFVDDGGADLGRKPAGDMSDYKTMPCFASVSLEEEGRQALVTVSSPLKASAGARQFTMEGELVLFHAAKKVTGEARNVAIAEGTEFMLGPQKATITGVRKQDGKMAFDVNLPDPPPTFEVEDLDLKDAAGEDVGASCSKTRVAAEGQAVKYNVHFSGVRSVQDALTIDYEVWSESTEVRVPFKITAPVAEGGVAPAMVMPVVPAPVPGPAPVQIKVETTTRVSAKPDAAKAAPSSDPTAVVPVAPAAVSAADAGAWPSLKVAGIMGQGAQGSAIINGKIVGVGEKIDGVQVLGIGKQGVTLKYEGKTRLVPSGGSTP